MKSLEIFLHFFLFLSIFMNGGWKKEKTTQRPKYFLAGLFINTSEQTMIFHFQ